MAILAEYRLIAYVEEGGVKHVIGESSDYPSVSPGDEFYLEAQVVDRRPKDGSFDVDSEGRSIGNVGVQTAYCHVTYDDSLKVEYIPDGIEDDCYNLSGKLVATEELSYKTKYGYPYECSWRVGGFVANPGRPKDTQYFQYTSSSGGVPFLTKDTESYQFIAKLGLPADSMAKTFYTCGGQSEYEPLSNPSGMRSHSSDYTGIVEGTHDNKWWRPFWRVKMRAVKAGTVNFIPHAVSDVASMHTTRLYGRTYVYGTSNPHDPAVGLRVNPKGSSVLSNEIEYTPFSINVEDSSKKVRVRLDVTDADGNSMSGQDLIMSNNEYYLRCYVRDLRPAGDNWGLANAYVDVNFPKYREDLFIWGPRRVLMDNYSDLYEDAMIEFHDVIGSDVSHEFYGFQNWSSPYILHPAGDTPRNAEGILNEVGAKTIWDTRLLGLDDWSGDRDFINKLRIGGSPSTEGDEFELFSLPFRCVAPGKLDITPNMAEDNEPRHYRPGQTDEIFQGLEPWPDGEMQDYVWGVVPEELRTNVIKLFDAVNDGRGVGQGPGPMEGLRGLQTVEEDEVEFLGVSYAVTDGSPDPPTEPTIYTGSSQNVVGYWQHGESTNAVKTPWVKLKQAIKKLIDGSSTSEVVTISYSYIRPFAFSHAELFTNGAVPGVESGTYFELLGELSAVGSSPAVEDAIGGVFETNADGEVQHYNTFFLGDGADEEERTEHDQSFRSQISLAFQQWKELFEDLWSGLTLNFVDLGDEAGVAMPSSVFIKHNFYDLSAGGFTLYPGGVREEFDPRHFTYSDVGDIRISMHEMDGAHGALAHAYFPLNDGREVLGQFGALGGDLHFDVAEDYRAEGTDGVGFSILYIAAHELGHAFGLGHDQIEVLEDGAVNIVDNPDSLMGTSVSESTDFSTKIGSLKNSEPERAALRHLYGRSFALVKCSGVGAFVSTVPDEDAGVGFLLSRQVACSGTAQFLRAPVLPKITTTGSGLNFTHHRSTGSTATLPNIVSIRFYVTGNGTVTPPVTTLELSPELGEDDLRYRNRNNVLVHRHGWSKTDFERLPDVTLSCPRVTHFAPYTAPSAPAKIAVDDICDPDKDKDNIIDLSIKAQKGPRVSFNLNAAKVKAAHNASLQKMNAENIESQGVKIANSAKPKKKNKLRSKL